MDIPPELLPVVQITLPIILAMFAGIAYQNRRIDDLRADMNTLRADMNRQFDRVWEELRAIRMELHSHGERIAKLEERIPPLVHR